NNYQSALIELNAWLTSDTLFAPAMTNPSMLVESAEDRPYNLQSHPVLGMARDKVEVADALYGVAKSNFLPTFSIKYGFQEIAGQSGFNSFSVGISIPLFF